MSETAIRIEGLGKQYRIGRRERYHTLRDTLTDAVSAPIRRLRSMAGPGLRPATDTTDLFWALRDVSFEVLRGAVVGIIGRNGAGKSTLLKILSRITEPTQGRVEIHGRVGSLLEVGTGFHPELTGRENIFLNGAILGMRRSEIMRKFDEIVSFAEVEQFLDTPVKHYSSGMYMRLAFAVAAHLEPEILLVDEVLAVGDFAFQKKCLGKMGDVAAGGRTILFVSHNLAAIRTLCNFALSLSAGQVKDFGRAHDVTYAYLQSCSPSRDCHVWESPRAPVDGERIRLKRISIQSLAADPKTPIAVGTPLQVEIVFWNRVSQSVLNPCIEMYNDEDVCVFVSFPEPERYPAGLVRAVCDIPGDLLNSSSYRTRVLIVRDATECIAFQEGPTFEVHDLSRHASYYGKWAGAIRPALNWKCETLTLAVN
jgi:lipopolysaccharide transport system ATP-binding protein